MEKMSAVYVILFIQLLLLAIRVWSFIQLIQSKNARCKHLIIQLGADASFSKELVWITDF